MEPVKYQPMDNKKYVYALCKCPLPADIYAIRMEKVPGQTEYPYHCDKCGVSGVVNIGNVGVSELIDTEGD